MKTRLVRHMTHDETFETDDTVLRIRIWQGEHATPIVLVSETDPDCESQWSASTVATYINEAILRHPLHGFLFFECIQQGQVGQVHFEYFGNVNRLRYFKPTFTHRSWEYIEDAIGEQIER